MTTTTQRQHNKLTELNKAEEPAKALLMELGYTYVPNSLLDAERNGRREVLLKGRLIRALLRLNDWMGEDDAGRAIHKLENVPEFGIARNQRIHEYLTYGMPLDVADGSGSPTRIVRFFDFDNPHPDAGKNEFIVTTQVRVRRGNEKDTPGVEPDDTKLVIPDIVLFVNGIPLVVMEAKAPTLMDQWRFLAVRQLRRYQEADPQFQGKGAPALFQYNLLMVAHCGDHAAYGTLGAPENFFFDWKNTLPFTEQEAREQFGLDRKMPSQDGLIIGLLNPVTLLDVLRDFVTFETEGGKLVKKLPRYQQYRAVKKAIHRIREKNKPEERGGVIWHTQGSGKSLTMLWTAVKLRREAVLDNPTIVVITDRTQLDTQISDTFSRTGFPAPERANSIRKLRALLSGTHGRTVFTTIQKFEDVLNVESGRLDHLNPSEDVVVMVDEAHRTQYGPLAARMRKALPNAAFIGFTGTPINKGMERSTLREFGPLIDSYTMTDSVRDGATVEIKYEARLTELSIQGPNTLDKLFDTIFSDHSERERELIKRRYATKDSIAKTEQRIELIALDIADHFKNHIQPNGFKAQVVAPDRLTAVKYWNHLRNFDVAAYPIITFTNDDGTEFNEAKDMPPQTQIVEKFKDPDGEPQILIVVDMLITGFDAPVEQVLYLDRSIREHALLQAIARVNRRFNRKVTDYRGQEVTIEKTFGLVVDYYGVSNELTEALAIFTDDDVDDIQKSFTSMETDPADVIESAARQAERHFDGLDRSDYVRCAMRFVDFSPDRDGEDSLRSDLYERFDYDYRSFARLVDQYLPNPRALDYADRLKKLTLIRNYIRANYLREDANIDWSGVSAKVKKLLDERITADEVTSLMTPMSVLAPDFDERIQELPGDEARASLIEHAIKAQVTEKLQENPVFYQRLSERLQEIIHHLRQQIIDAAEAVKQLQLLKHEAASESSVAASHGLTEVSFALYELLEASRNGRSIPTDAGGIAEERVSYQTTFDQELKSVALRVEVIIKQHEDIVDWHMKEDVQRRMRRDIKRELRQTGEMSEKELDSLARNMVDVARRRWTA